MFTEESLTADVFAACNAHLFDADIESEGSVRQQLIADFRLNYPSTDVYGGYLAAVEEYRFTPGLIQFAYFAVIPTVNALFSEAVHAEHLRIAATHPLSGRHLRHLYGGALPDEVVNALPSHSEIWEAGRTEYPWLSVLEG